MRAGGEALRLGAFRGFAFDLDGCVWAGSTLLPGARELVEALRAAGHGVVTLGQLRQAESPAHASIRIP